MSFKSGGGMDGLIKIGDLAARTGVSVRSVRYYEEQGLLRSRRTPSGHRHYTEDDVERVRFLQDLFAAGLSSRAIREVLPCAEAPNDDNTEESYRVLVRERDQLDRRITELQRARAALDRMAAANRAYLERDRTAPDRECFAPELSRRAVAGALREVGGRPVRDVAGNIA
ncbi:MAG TPA: MerR family transcriptional regulator [Microlunatus sp.]|nr:MerR family transcriptional regulator [Microlunatus sp.]